MTTKLEHFVAEASSILIEVRAGTPEISRRRLFVTKLYNIVNQMHYVDLVQMLQDGEEEILQYWIVMYKGRDCTLYDVIKDAIVDYAMNKVW